MQNKFLFTLMLAPAAVFAQKGDYVVKGKLGAGSDSSKVYLMHYVDEKVATDSAVVTKGAFEFKGSIDAPAQAMLVLRHKMPSQDPRQRDAIIFYLDKGNVNITGTDSVANAKISGSKVNEENEQLSAQLKPFEEREKALMVRYQTAPQEMQQSEAFQKELQDADAKIKADQKVVLVDFIKKHPKSFVSLDVLQNVGGNLPDNVGELDTLYQGLSADIRTSKNGVRYGDMITNWKHTAIGAMAPEFTQNDTLGNPVKLTDFRGKYLLVDFWASWCGPCRRENPNVVAAFNKHKAQNFTILSVSLDQPGAKDAWLKAIHHDNLTWTHVSDLQFWNNAVAKLYGVQSVPQNFLLDPTGKIIAKNLRGEELDKKLDELLKN
jgi:peroxiredoxin